MKLSDLSSDQRAAARVVAAVSALRDTLPIELVEDLQSGDRILVDQEGDHSWWRLVAGNNEVVCVSEMYEGPDHNLVAFRQAEHFAARLAFHTPVIDVWAVAE